jgi:hypothetical protein
MHQILLLVPLVPYPPASSYQQTLGTGHLVSSSFCVVLGATNAAPAAINVQENVVYFFIINNY